MMHYPLGFHRESRYPGVFKELDPRLPEQCDHEVSTCIYFDADWAHDTLNRRSCTGIIIFMGSTPVIWHSKCQTHIEGSTYGAEFTAGRTVVNEACSIQYILQCLVLHMSEPTEFIEDNLGMLQSCLNVSSDLKKKACLIAYHVVWESVAAGIIHPIKVRDNRDNLSDALTKALGKVAFHRVIDCLYLSPTAKRHKDALV